MKYLLFLFMAALSVALYGCNSDGNRAHQVPIDSTNVNGTAPVTNGGDNPSADTAKTNVNDTGTKASNVHNTGPY